MQRALKTGAMVALLIGGLSLPAQAVPITTAGLSITNGDKLFNNFTCSIVQDGAGGTPTACSSVDVTASTDAFGNVGLRFQLGGGIIAPGSVDILIGYDATVVGSTQLISDIHLAFNGAFTGTGFTTVTETVTGLIPAAGIVGQVTVTNPPMDLDNVILLSQLQTSVRVSKDILLGVAAPGPGTASISFVDQFLSQTTEPASLALLGTALFGFGVRMRRRSKNTL